ncbi:hypothetical protein BH18ACT15_BH18ACT15_00620 [soil metagenome]
MQRMRLLNFETSLRPELAAALWNRDPTVWGPGDDDPSERLGWLDLPVDMRGATGRLLAFTEQVRSEGIESVVLLGMGGSSLAPEVFASTFGSAAAYPSLTVLDSTHPDQLRAVRASVDLERTLWLVSSKSGGTIETMSLYEYFRDLQPNPAHFVAITDPGTSLADLGREGGFRDVFLNPPDIGGRFSALSFFGLVPAALLGVDVEDLLRTAARMAEACGRDVPPSDNSGLVLGCALGELAGRRRDKLTFVISDAIGSLGLWLEQLVAESTGKNGTGIVPVVDEPWVAPTAYGDDRVFAVVRLRDDDASAARARALRDAGHPVIDLPMPGPSDIAGQMWLWEMATSVAGAVLGINAFDQPNVEAAKRLAKEMLEAGEVTWEAGDPRALFDGVEPGETVALLAFAAIDEEKAELLKAARRRFAERGVATMQGFGPRYLHSTGQLHKGGPPNLRALVILDEPDQDLPIPRSGYGFARLIGAQAAGDVKALESAGRRVERATWETFSRWTRD